MSGKNILKNNRVFLANRNNEQKINIYTTVTVNFSGIDTKLYVSDTSNFAESGELVSVSSLIRVKYSSKGDNYFNIIRDYDNNAFIIGILFRSGVQLKQERIVVEKELAGWYVDGKTLDATLKVGPANVITPGAIRFVDSEDGNGNFQGCVKVNENEIKWVNFNASEGRAGKDANINTCLRYECVGSGEGKLFSENIIDVSNSEENNTVSVRSITADKKNINGREVEGSISVKTVGDDVLIGLGDVNEVVYDLTAKFNEIKGNPVSDKKLNCYGEQIRVRVCSGEKVHKGQIVAIGLFKDNKLDGTMYYGVRAMSISETGKELLKYQIGADICYKYSFGLSRMNGSDGDIVQVLVSGIGLLRIGNNVAGMNTISSIEGRYLGETVLLDRDGYGFICQNITKLPETYMEIGGLMETGNNVGQTGNYVLVKFNPSIVDL
jgi:hypothetical protein